MGYWSDSPTPDDSDAFWIKFDLLLEPSILQDGDIVFAWLELADPYNDGYFETVGCYNRISNLSLARWMIFECRISMEQTRLHWKQENLSRTRFLSSSSMWTVNWWTPWYGVRTSTENTPCSGNKVLYPSRVAPGELCWDHILLKWSLRRSSRPRLAYGCSATMVKHS